MLRTKSVSSPIHREKDGLRILTTRFRGRFLPVSRYDVWMPSLGPSERLLRAGLDWSEFSRRFLEELFLDGPIDARSATIKNHGQKFTLRLIRELSRKGNVTLMCHCPEEQQQCHRHLLRKIILSKTV